jgi:hypothetical protein
MDAPRQLCSSFQPLVSVILTTRDRPTFFLMAMSCYRGFSYPNRELIVVDDGMEHPIDPTPVESAGGRVVRVEPGTPIGEKLNRGIAVARGSWCQKMDDDDWYGPEFLTGVLSSVASRRAEVCRPSLAFVMPFLFFDLGRWEVRRSPVNNLPGATLFFAREDWKNRPFRPISQDEDFWFVIDQTGAGSAVIPARDPQTVRSFLAVRHRALREDRGHTWTHQADGSHLEDYLQQDRPIFETPEQILPSEDLAFYQQIREGRAASR